MNRIVKGKLYDTSTAEEIGRRSYGCAKDLDRFTEILYRKTNGELFLYGSGGPLSCYYRRLSGNCRASGESILCGPDFDPQKWAMDNLDGDSYIRLFGPVEE